MTGFLRRPNEAEGDINTFSKWLNLDKIPKLCLFFEREGLA